MKSRKLTALLVSAALIVGVSSSALAADKTVPGAVYCPDGRLKEKSCGQGKGQDKIKEDLQKAGVKDVPADNWAAGSISVMVEAGLMKPDTQGNIKPEAKVKADEGIAIFAKVLGIASKTDDAQTAVAKAKEAGIVSKDASTGHDMSRMEVAKLIAKALGIEHSSVAKASFKDTDGLADEDSRLLAALYEAGIFKGYPDGTFNPNGILTNAEIAILLDRILGVSAK